MGDRRKTLRALSAARDPTTPHGQALRCLAETARLADTPAPSMAPETAEAAAVRERARKILAEAAEILPRIEGEVPCGTK